MRCRWFGHLLLPAFGPATAGARTTDVAQNWEILQLTLLNHASGPRAGHPGPVFGAGFGRKDNVNGLKFGPKLPGPKARQIWDRIWLVHASFGAKAG